MNGDDIGKRLDLLLELQQDTQKTAAQAVHGVAELRGVVAGLTESINRVSREQDATTGQLHRYAESITTLQATCSGRGKWCDQRFKDASEDLQGAVKGMDKTWREALRPIHARMSKQSREVERLHGGLGEVKEDTGVIHLREAREEGQRAERTRTLKLGAKVVGALLGAGVGGAGLLKVLQIILGG